MSSSPDKKSVLRPSLASMKPAVSFALSQALTHVKDFMTDSQKALILLKEAKSFMDGGDFQGAVDCLNEAISYNPNVTLFNTRAQCHKMLDMYEEAYFDYSYTIRLESEVGSHFCARGLCLSKLKKLGMAMEDLDVAIQLDPCPAHYYARAMTYADFGNHEAAIKDFTSALNEGQFTVNLDMKIKNTYKRALSHFELKNFEEVVKDTTAVIQYDATMVQPRALMGRALKILNDHKKAEEQLTTAVILDENQAALYIERGDIRFRTGLRNKIIEAIYDFDKAINLLEGKLHPKFESSGKHGKLLRSNFSFRSTIRKSDSDEIGVGKEGVKHSPLAHSSSFRGNFKSTNVLDRENVFMTVPGAVTPISYFRDLEIQLAEAYFKRAQAKLYIESDTFKIEEALVDALKTIQYVPDDDDYQMVTATCYIRLNRYEEAMDILKLLMERSPDNYKALYNYSFCQRASGKQRNAIEELTKIISHSQEEIQSITSSKLAIPIHRVYEMRGTLFHEVQAHKLALMDLGRAIAINPSRADNYFLRGDCHCKLGNYEQALNDYNLAESKSFSDKVSLHISRGSVYRLLGNSKSALKDFSSAHTLLDQDDKLGQIRVLSFQAFCFIDMAVYPGAYGSLIKASKLNQQLLEYNLKILYDTEQEFESGANENDQFTSLTTSNSDELQNKIFQAESDVLYLRRVDWILNYHLALTLYMQRLYANTETLLEVCLSEDSEKYIPDDITKGIMLFFLGLTKIQLEKYEEAEDRLLKCMASHWTDTHHNKFICKYAIAKLHQYQHKHNLAVDEFTEALAMERDNPYCLFSRAWSFKALKNFTAAGNDFETARQLRSDDPNFSIDYKRISQFEYMILETEPDITEKFPALLPLPGLGAR